MSQPPPQWGNQPQPGSQPQPGPGAPQWGSQPPPGFVPPPGFQPQPGFVPPPGSQPQPGFVQPPGFQPQPGQGTPPPPKPPKKRGGCLKVGGILVGLVVIIIIIAAAVSSGGGKTTTSAGQPGSTSTTQAAASTTTKAAAPTTAAADPTKTFTDQFGTFAPVSKSGSGSSVIAVPSGAKAGIVTATYSGSSNFAISMLDANNQSTGDLLVNNIGKYSGTTAFGLSSLGGEPAKFKIEASGAWTVNIQPIASAPVLAVPAKDTGDKVFIYTGQADSWAITNNGKSNFVVTSDGDMPDLLVNEIGSYSGTVPVTAGPAIISVQSDGAWTISKG